MYVEKFDMVLAVTVVEILPLLRKVEEKTEVRIKLVYMREPPTPEKELSVKVQPSRFRLSV